MTSFHSFFSMSCWNGVEGLPNLNTVCRCTMTCNLKVLIVKHSTYIYIVLLSTLLDIWSMVIITSMLCWADCFCSSGPPAVQETNLPPQCCLFFMLRQTANLVKRVGKNSQLTEKFTLDYFYTNGWKEYCKANVNFLEGLSKLCLIFIGTSCSL